MEDVDTSLRHRISHMAEFIGITGEEAKNSLWYKEEWRPYEKWNQLMMVYEQVCEHPRTSETSDYKKDTVYIDRFEVGTNQIFMSLWCIQPNGEFDHSTIYHAHSRLESVQGDCESTKEMFFKSLSDFVTLVQYTQDLYGED